MKGFTELESLILDELWNNHVYFVHRRYTYTIPLIAEAIKKSENTLDEKRIEVHMLLV